MQERISKALSDQAKVPPQQMLALDEEKGGQCSRGQMLFTAAFKSTF